MTWPLQPIGPRPNEPQGVARIERSRRVDQRDARDEDARREEQRRRREQERSEGTPAPGTPDADGHIDVLA